MVRPDHCTLDTQPWEQMPDIQECPAYSVCRDKKVDCGVCLEISVEAWREHVKKVLAGQKTD